MNDNLKLMCVLAHPDDESMGVGGTLARYAAEGIETYLVTATRGQRGWPAQPEAYPGPEALGRRREKELRAAGELLGLRRRPQLFGRRLCDRRRAVPGLKAILQNLEPGRSG